MSGARELLVPLGEGGNTVSSGAAPQPHENPGADILFHKQVSSSAGLDALTRGNPGAQEEVQCAINAAANARFPLDKELGGMENRQELDRLVAMAADLGEIVVSCMLRRTGQELRHIETRRQELS